MAGFEPTFANELVGQYAETYKTNHPDTQLLVGDVRQLSEIDLKSSLGLKNGELDLLAGGPPCQGFSVNAPIRSLDDERNHLFKDFLRVVGTLMPKAVLIENVPGMVSLGKGTVIEQIYAELESLGYTVKHAILFAGHYGIPQMRFRMMIVGILGNSSFEFPKPEYLAKSVANFAGAKELCIKINEVDTHKLKKHTSVWDAMSDLPAIIGKGSSAPTEYLSLPKTEYQKYLREKSELVINHVCNKIAPINMERLKYIPQGGSWRDIPYDLLPKGLQRARRSDHTKRYGRLHPEALCSTVLTKCDPHWGSFFHPYESRVISVREAARIQSFPDDYVFTGGITQQYEQVGNAVPPLLAKAVGQEIKKAIGE